MLLSQSLEYFKLRTKEIFIDSEATSIRTLLALASLGWFFALIMPFDTFERQAFTWMKAVGTEEMWAFLLLLHFIGVMWRLYDPVRRIKWAFAINAYGAVIWTFMTGCVSFSLGVFSPTIILECAIIVSVWISLIGTGTNEGKGSP